MVGGVGEVLGFEAEGGVELVGGAGFAFDGSVEEVAAVELDAGLIGEDFEDASAGGFVDFGGFG